MRRAWLVSAVLLIACLPRLGEGHELIVNVDGRRTISLNGSWQIIVDPYESGLYHRGKKLSRGYFRDAKPRHRWDRVEYEFTKANVLLVPGDWNTQRPEFFFYEGSVWYKRTFGYQRKPGTRLFVYFGAANYETIVWLNTEELGKHVGGFTPFTFEITESVQDGLNTLIVKVDNQRKPEGVPTLETDWWNNGGLTRRVLLVEVPETFIRDYFVHLAEGTCDRIEGWVQLDGTRLEQRVTIEIPELGVRVGTKTDSKGRASFSVRANPELWSPAHPKLYRVVIRCETDEVVDRIGFRTIETRGTDILLNGEPIFLRGVCIHEEAPFRNGRAFCRKDAEILLGWVKELNGNFARLAHYPHNEFMPRVADSLGILLWEEIPVYWAIQWDNPSTFENARNQLRELITRDKNRACVILWSVANETPVIEARTRFLSRLVRFAHSLDPTQLVTAAMERRYARPDTVVIDDPLGEVVDVFGCNEYIGWYDGLPDKCDRVVWQMTYEKPLIMSEFGGGALYGYHGDELTRWTEEYQENLYRHQVGMLSRILFLRGTTPWILMDFRSPRRPLPGIQDWFNRKGLISNRGQKKKAFCVMREWYAKLRQKWGR